MPQESPAKGFDGGAPGMPPLATPAFAAGAQASARHANAAPASAQERPNLRTAGGLPQARCRTPQSRGARPPGGLGVSRTNPQGPPRELREHALAVLSRSGPGSGVPRVPAGRSTGPGPTPGESTLTRL